MAHRRCSNEIGGSNLSVSKDPNHRFLSGRAASARIAALLLLALAIPAISCHTTTGGVPSLVLPSDGTPQAGTAANPEQTGPTLTPSITPIPGPQDIANTRMLWEWEETAPPSALAAAGDRLAVIVADGRFQWLDAASAQPLGGDFLWPDGIRGESWGQVYADNEIAVLAAVETWVSGDTGFPETRSQVIVFDSAGQVLWRLPELSTQHLYSAALAADRVFAGTHHGGGSNVLGAYDRLTGAPLWETGGDSTGFEVIVHDGARVYALLNEGSEGGGVAAYDAQSGGLLWTQSDPAVRLSDDLLIAGNRLFVLTQPAAVALDPADGRILWSTQVALAPEAGMAAQADRLYIVPAPTVELDYRPGVIGVNAGDGALAWHALLGSVADPVAASGMALWAIVKDYEAGRVELAGLDAVSGLEYARLPVSEHPERIYHLVASGRTVYVLGDSLLAFGY